MMDIFTAIRNQHSEKIALSDEVRTISYGDLSGLIDEKAQQLEKFSCIALAMDNSAEWILWDLAALKAGVVLVPNPPNKVVIRRGYSLLASEMATKIVKLLHQINGLYKKIRVNPTGYNRVGPTDCA